MTRTYNLFISHSWKHEGHYYGLENLLKSFGFNNYSVPKDDPIHNAGNDIQLQQAIKNQMSPCSAVIVSVRPWGNRRISQTVRDAADRLVGWNTQSVIGAIKKVVR